MKKFTLTLAAIASLLTVAPNLHGAETKVGIVNFKTCVEGSKLGAAEQKNFEGLKKQMEDVLSEKEKTLNELAAKFNDADYLDSLSNEAEAELKHRFRTLSGEMQQHQNQYMQVLQQANFKIIQKIGEAIGEASKTVAKNKQLDIILNEEMSFYHADALDVSSEVVAIMNKDYKEEK